MFRSEEDARKAAEIVGSDDAVAERKSAEAKRQDEQRHEAAVAQAEQDKVEKRRKEEEQKLVDAAVDKRKQAAAERGGRGKESEQTEHAAERGEKGSTHIQGESDSRVPEAHVGLNENEVDELVSHMENSASDIPQIELTPSNWFEQFGENGMVSTPMGEVKMGENQIVKLFEKGRSEQFGMIKPTLEHPQVIIEVPSEAIDGNTERTSSLLFIKTFIGKDGKKVYYFKSVTVRKDGLEVSISSHYDRAKRVKEALKKGELLYRFDGGAQTERHPADASVTTPHDKMQGEDDTIQTAASQPHGGTFSVSKDSASEAKQQEGGGKSAVAMKEKPKKDDDDGPDGPTGGKGKPKGGGRPDSQTYKVDNQGNPLNADGTLKLEKVTSVDDLTDEDFSAPTRNVEQPKADTKQLDEAIVKAEKEGNIEEVKKLKAEKAFCEKHIPEKGDKKVGYKKQKDTLDITSIVNGKEVGAQLRGIHYENGFAVATDGHTMVITRQEYPTEYEGKTIGKNGEVIDLKFPIWVNAIPMLNSDEYSRSEFEDVLKDASKRYKEFKKKYKEEHPEATTINVKNEMVEYEIDHQILLDKENCINVTDANILLNILKWCGEDARVFKFKGELTFVFIKSKGTYALMLSRFAGDRQESDTRLIGKAKPIAETTEETKQPILKKEEKPANANNKKKKTEASKPTDNKDKEAPQDKIDDVGEHIAGARKDALAKLSQSVADVTLESLIELPASKAFKRPDLKKAVKEGALRETDARFAEAVMAAYLGTAKPKLKEGYKRASSEEAVRAWAEYAKEGVDMLARLFSLDEAGRDKFMAEVRSRKAYSEEEVRERQRQLEQWNPGRKYNGTCYPLNPVDVLARVMERLGYEPGAKVTLPVVAAAPDSGFGQYVLTTRNGKSYYPGRRLTTIDDVVDEIVYAAKVENADQDTDHPAGKFSVEGVGEPLKGSTGKWLVVTQRSLTAAVERHTFDSKEEAEAFAQKFLEGRGKYRYASKPTEEARTTGYSQYEIVYKHDNPTKGTYAYMPTGKVYGSLEEARAAIDGEHDELNSVVNAKLAEEKGKSGEGKKKDYLKIVSYTEDGRTWKYGVVLADKYAPKTGALDTMPFYLGDGFSTLKEAQAFVDEHREEWDAKVSEIDKARRDFVYFNGTGERTGKDWRKGADVSAGQLMEQFGFRGVQFGNWTNQRDRQAAVNGAFDALMDLAQILGVSPRALSLNGELGLAFGSRWPTSGGTRWTTTSRAMAT